MKILVACYSETGNTAKVAGAIQDEVASLGHEAQHEIQREHAHIACPEGLRPSRVAGKPIPEIEISAPSGRSCLATCSAHRPRSSAP